MSIVVRVAISCFVAGRSLLASEQCGLPDEAVRRLVHYQEWSVYWMGSVYWRGTETEVPSTEQLKVLKNGPAWLVYSEPNRTAYRITDSTVSAKTCWQHRNWVECLTDLRTPPDASSISDLLLGKVESAGPIDTRSVCSFSLKVPPTQRRWHPSEETEQKQQLLGLLSSEVSRAVKHFGAVQGAVCSNFNVYDPEIWVIVDIVPPSGNPNQFLVGVSIDHSVPPRMTAAVVRSVTASDATLVQRIRRDSLQLPPARK